MFQETEHPYNLRINHTFRTYGAKTVQTGTEVLLFMKPKISSLFPSNINNSETLEILNKRQVIGSQITPDVRLLKP